MGKPCVCGCEALKIDLKAETVGGWRPGPEKGRRDFHGWRHWPGYPRPGALIEPVLSPEFNTLLQWADEVRTLGIRANADTPEDARRAREFGAEGIGLCRTEHMFMATDRLPIVQEMILADTQEQRKAALARLLPIQQEDFLRHF